MDLELASHGGKHLSSNPFQRLQLQFDASVPEFTLSEADHPVELYSALFQSISDVDDA